MIDELDIKFVSGGSSTVNGEPISLHISLSVKKEVELTLWGMDLLKNPKFQNYKSSNGIRDMSRQPQNFYSDYKSQIDEAIKNSIKEFGEEKFFSSKRLNRSFRGKLTENGEIEIIINPS